MSLIRYNVPKFGTTEGPGFDYAQPLILPYVPLFTTQYKITMDMDSD